MNPSANKSKKPRPKAKVRQNLCVSCGTCLPVCPTKAIFVWKGLFAQVETKKCVGCGKCVKACPASVIDLQHEEVQA